MLNVRNPRALACLVGLATASMACAASQRESTELAPVGTAPTPITAQAPAAQVGPAPTVASVPASPTCAMFAKPGTVKRSALVRVIDAGLPRWLQGVEGDRTLANHRFQGWLVKSLHPSDPCYREIELRPGDVVQKINGRSIERPEQAFDVAESLRTAPAVVVDYLRDGKAQRMTIAIANE
jgi:S1-C subfamily serine protease